VQKLHYTFPRIKDEATQSNVAAREDVGHIRAQCLTGLGGH
jgi:hypothetical protein